jgi:hypothetical protein
MGDWGPKPWENDWAADWFAKVFDITRLVEHVDKALNQDPEQNPYVVRAAAYLLVQLGRTYIWPPEHLERQIKLAIQKLRIVRSSDELREGEADCIDAEIFELQQRQG